ncbi:MAG: hypothetical protein Q8N51_09630, partial [Gammaproteobacteria bacterium]|nr:hypothetical protein [Gammaproteobacteria bacterium]
MESNITPRRRIVPPGVLAFLDTCCIVGAFAFAINSSVPFTDPLLPPILANLPYLLVVILVWYSAALERNLWGNRNRQEMVHYLTTVTKAVGDACVFCVFVMVLFTRGGLDHKFLVTFCMATLLLLLLFRFVLRLLIHELRRMGYNQQRAIIVGANERTVHLIDVIRSQSGLGYNLAGILDNDPDRAEMTGASGAPFLGC